MQEEEQAKAKITVELPDGTITTYETNTFAVVATGEGGTNAMVYSHAAIRESIKLLHGLNSAKKRVTESHPILGAFGEMLAEDLASKDLRGGGVIIEVA